MISRVTGGLAAVATTALVATGGAFASAKHVKPVEHPTVKHHTGWTMVCKTIAERNHGKAVKKHGKVVKQRKCTFHKVSVKLKAGHGSKAPGATGERGPQGPQGPSGPEGPQGPVGQPPVQRTTTVFSNVPNPLPESVVSLGFEANSVSEFGGQYALAHGVRTNPNIGVVMDSWACQTGAGATCATVPGAKFSEPITLNIYSVGSDGTSVGSLLYTRTNTFEIPYRPSASGLCSNGDYMGADNSCHSSEAYEIWFDLTSATLRLPDRVIISVAYNTSDYGYQPYGNNTGCKANSGNCPYDSLNVGVVGSEIAPSAGSYPVPTTVYVASTSNGATTNPNGVFGPDTNDSANWSDGSGYYQPAIEVSTTG